jgi:hypothetical protein
MYPPSMRSNLVKSAAIEDATRWAPDPILAAEIRRGVRVNGEWSVALGLCKAQVPLVFVA